MPSKSLSFLLFGEDVTAGKAFKKLGADAETSGAKVKGAFSGGAMMAVGGLAIGLGAAVKAAGDFQLKTNVLVTAAGESASNLGLIRKGIEGIAMSTGTSISQLTDAAYVAEKAGYRGADALTLMKAAAQGAREEGANLSTVLNAQTSIMASYHLKAADSVMVVNMMKTAAGEAKTTMEEFSGSLSTVLPIASANKIAFADIGGVLATLTQHGTSAAEATQEMANSIRNLSAPNAVAVKEMWQLGISSIDVQQNLGKRGLSGTLDYLSETVKNKVGPSGTLLLSTLNASKAAAADVTIMFDKLGPATQKIAKGYMDGSVTAGEYRKAIKDLPGDQNVLARQFKTTEDNARGFQAQLRQGLPLNQTYSDAIKKMTGGANGLNTTLQITGESAAGTAERIKAIADSARNAGTSVSGWESTQKLFNVQLDMLKERASVAGIEIGTRLIPVLSSVADFALKNQTAILGVMGALTAYTVAVGLAGVATKAFVALETIGSAIGTVLVGGLGLASAAMSSFAAATGIGGAAVEGLETTYVGAMLAMDTAMGPVGLALGAITIAVGFATKGFGLFGGGAKTAIAPVDSLTQAILQDKDALGQLTQAQINNKLSSTGAYDAALRLGVSQDTVLAATMGNAKAQKILSSAIQQANTDFNNATGQVRTYDSTTGIWTTTTKHATQAQKDANDAASKLANTTGLLSGQLAASKVEADNEAVAVKGLAAWMKNVPKSIRTAVVVDTGTAYQVIRSVIDYANSQTAVIHVTATNPITGGTMGGRQAFASGTDYVSHGGMYTVGEQGRETVYLPKGARVANASQTRATGSPGGGNVTVIINGADLSNLDALGRTVVRAIGQVTKNGTPFMVAGRQV